MIRRELDIFLTALMFFTRVPVPKAAGYSYHPDYLQASSRYFALIGWLVGGVAAAVYWLASQWWPVSIAVLLSMGASILLTGAFHEDGWADVCDGFGGGFTKERVLEIMKDSRLGTYGTIALLFALGLKALALSALGTAGWVPVSLLAAHSVSRLASTSLIYTHRYVRENEDSKAKPLATRIGGGSMLVAAVCGLLPMLLLPFKGWAVLLGVIVVTVGMSRWFVRRIGGYTGDCLGAVQQVTELTMYVLLVGLVG